MESIQPCHPQQRWGRVVPVLSKKCFTYVTFFLFMYFVYIIQSELDQSYYKGFTEDLLLRLQRHNNGESTYTRNKMPWHFVHIELFLSKTEALKREKALKKI